MLRITTLILTAALPLAAHGQNCSSKNRSSASTCSSKTMLTSLKGDHDIVDVAVAAGSFKTLAAALEAADLVEALRGDGPFTVFAPTDEAFAKLPEGTVETLLRPENKELLQSILTYHVVSGAVTAKQVVTLSTATMLNGQRAAIQVGEDGVTIAGVNVVKTDVEASNGVIHVLDAVMMPATDDLVVTAKNAGAFQTLLAAAQAAGLAGTLADGGPFTVFAPTDDAFAKLPKQTLEALLQPQNADALKRILLYHVVEGRVFADQAIAAGRAATLAGEEVTFEVRDGRLFVGDSSVASNDVQASNGVIHVIDTVLMPPGGIDLQPAGRKVIGVYLDTPDQALATQLGIDRHGSLLVSRLVSGGHAEAAGVQRYDVITSIDGHPATEDALASAKSERALGEPVELGILRRGQRLALHVPVGVAKH